MSHSLVTPTPTPLQPFPHPKSVIRRFIARQTLNSSLILGVVLAGYMAAKTTSYIKAYPTVLAREKIAASLGSNVGIEALLGVAHHIETVPGYITWNFLCIISAGGAIWALLLATKVFRGEEEAGHLELLLAGQTTARQAAINTLLGIGRNLLIIYSIIAVVLLGLGHMHTINFTVSSCLFFALALVAAMAEFFAVGALASQLMPVRSRAAGLAATVFGISYMVRLIADTTTAHWLLAISPLGWIEKLQPMYDSKPLWLLPIAAFFLTLTALSIFLAGKRDLGASTFADKDIAPARTALLHNPFTAALRLTRAVNLSWLGAVGVTAFLYGVLAKSAVQAFSQSATARQELNKLTHTSQTGYISVFMGITFFFVMLLVMFYTASAVGRMRQDESEGYLDNLLVRPVSRRVWVWDRSILIVLVVVAAGALSTVATWAGEASQHSGVAFHILLLASINAMIPALFILGVGIFALGILPRLSSAITYGAIGWSFLIIMLSSGLNLNHWLLDTSILHHVTLAPAVSPNWTTNSIMVIIGILLAVIGTVWFTARDLQLE